MSRLGWIDEVDGGVVYGRIGDDEFELPLLSVPEDQRVDLEPGCYCSFVNGHLLVEKTMWSSQEIEEADEEASRIYHMLHSPNPRAIAAHKGE